LRKVVNGKILKKTEFHWRVRKRFSYEHTQSLSLGERFYVLFWEIFRGVWFCYWEVGVLETGYEREGLVLATYYRRLPWYRFPSDDILTWNPYEHCINPPLNNIFPLDETYAENFGPSLKG